MNVRWTILVLAAAAAAVLAQEDKKTTSTTTAPPTTTTVPTTTAPPTTTTTAKPSPFPHNSGDWTTSCIRLKGALGLSVNGTKPTPIPPTSTPTSNCTSNSTQSITLSWEKQSLTLTFSANQNQTQVGKIPGLHYALVEVVVEMAPLKFTIQNLTLYQTELNHSYKCSAEEMIKSDGIELKLVDLQLEAFKENEEFSMAQECSLDGVTDVVPIAVGACLAGLVVIVLIAYLFGRRRSRARGYQSV